MQKEQISKSSFWQPSPINHKSKINSANEQKQNGLFVESCKELARNVLINSMRSSENLFQIEKESKATQSVNRITLTNAGFIPNDHSARIQTELN